MASSFPFVGRVREQAAIQSHLRSAVEGCGGLVLLGGEAGAGKSALVQSAVAAAPGCLAVVGRCPGPGETPPYGPWAEVVRRLQGERAGTTADLPPPFGPAPGDWSAAERAGALANWLGRQGRPLLVLLEDLHWADDATLALTRHLAARVPDWPALIIATYRTDELSRRHPLWRLVPELQRAGAAHLLLDRLNPAEVADLGARLLPPELGTPGLFAAVYARTNGLALFVREVFEAVLRTGEVPAPGAPLPQTLRQALDGKLDRLPPEAQAALEPAAVIGERFSYDLLARLAGMPEEALTDGIRAAVDWHVLEPRDADGAWFAFSHALLREALLARLVGVRRRRWHARVANALAAQPDPDPDAVAFHLVRARDPRASEYLLAAGDRARRLGDLARARDHFQHGLTLLPPDHPRRGEALVKLGWCLAWGEPARAAQCWEEAAAGGDEAAALWARHLLLAMAQSQNQQRPTDEVGAVMASQEALLADDRCRQLEASLFGQCAGYPRAGMLLVRRLAAAGETEQAREHLRDLAARALPGADHEIRAARMVLALLGGRMEEAAALCGQAIEKAHSLGDYRAGVSLRVNQLLLRLAGAADQPDELDALAEGLRAAEAEAWERAGQAHLPRGFSLTGVYRYFRGDWRGAWQNLVEATRTEPGAWGGILAYYAGRILLESGDPEGARSLVEAVPPYRPTDPVPLNNNILVLAHALRAELCLALGDGAQALAWLEGAERWPALAAAPFFRGHIQLARARWHRQAGSTQAATASASQALLDARATSSSILIIQAHQFLGELAAPDDPVTARGHFQAAMEVADRCRFPFVLALIRLARGQALATTREGLADLQATCAYFAAVGAEHTLGIARAALEAAQSKTAAREPALGAAEVVRLPDGLTAREAEISMLVARGLTDREVAASLFISRKTVDHHLRNIFNKTGVSNRAALAAYATRHGLVG